MFYISEQCLDQRDQRGLFPGETTSAHTQKEQPCSNINLDLLV